MKRWMKGPVLLGLMLAASVASAADHRDGPAAKGAPEADINDVYTWMSDDNTKLILVQTVGGLPGVANFSDAVQYAFHVGRGDDAPPTHLVAPVPASSTTDIVCEFDSNTAVACYVGTPGTPALDFFTGDASAADGVMSANGSFKIHTGNHADPFYFYLGGFAAARDLVVTAVGAGLLPPAAFEPSGCVLSSVMNTQFSTVLPSQPNFGTQTVSQVLLGLLNGTNNPMWSTCNSPAACVDANASFRADTFAENSALAIVIEIDKSILVGTGEYFYVHASTHEKP